MGNDIQHIHVEFHQTARPIYYKALVGFEDDAKEVDRHKEEYRFGQLKEKHIHSLKHDLEHAAGILIEQHQHSKQLHELQQGLQQIIKDYLHGFVMKSRAI